MCTTTLALGSRQLSVHGAIVTRLQVTMPAGLAAVPCYAGLCLRDEQQPSQH